MEISASLDPSAPDNIKTFLADLNRIPDISTHLDFMDGKYVPRQNISVEQYNWIIENSKGPVDAHLMIENPHIEWKKYFSKKLRSLCFHIETVTPQQACGILKEIKAQGICAGIAVDRDTNVQDILSEVLSLCDVITVMTIKAGLSGQQFMPELLEKVTFLKKHFPKCRIIVDGGVNAATAPHVIKAGTDTAVMGMFIYKAEDRAAAINSVLKI